MKKILIALFFFLMTTSLFADDSMEFVYYHNYRPYSWKENNQMHGILIDIINEAIQKRMGITVNHRGFPWARAQLMVKENKADAFVTCTTPARKIYTYISEEPVLNLTTKLHVGVNNPKIAQLRQVKSVSYAELKGYQLVDYIGNGWAETNLKGLNVIWLPKIDAIVPFLALGRADAWVHASQISEYNIKRLGYKGKVVTLPNVLSVAPMYLCIGKNSQFTGILPKFEKTIRKMRQSGIIQKIHDKYR